MKKSNSLETQLLKTPQLKNLTLFTKKLKNFFEKFKINGFTKFDRKIKYFYLL